MTRKQARLIMWIAVELVFVVLIFIASAKNNDFNITATLSGLGKSTREGSEILSTNVSFVARAFEVIGEWPAWIFASLSVFVIVRNLRKKMDNKLVLAGMILGDIAVVGFMFIGWRATFKYIAGSVKGWHYILISVFAIGCAVLIKFIVEKINKKTLRNMFFPAIVTLIAALCILAFTEIIKFAWGRVRLREIVEYSKTVGAEDALSKFTSWYRPNWFSGSKSFPSGHSAYNSLLFLIPIWLPVGTAERKRRFVVAGIGVWVAALMFSRLCAAAHYLSDVLFGFIIGFIITQIATVKYEKTFESRPAPKFIKTAPVMNTAPVRNTDTQSAAPRVQTRTQPEQERIPSASGLMNYKEDTKDVEVPQNDPAEMIPARRASAPARENRPLTPVRQTSFSLDRARAERAESEAKAAAEAENEAKKLDDRLKMASTGEMKKVTPDASIPVVPKQSAPQKPQRKSQPKPKRKKTAPQESDAVQMHFRYDSESNSLTTDISDD
ncbi:MAG: phosphatase PAP2 family protein [Clostridia bacterium]|nr:phosphatase PAP2 family protein [Clostridia bacterium]